MIEEEHILSDTDFEEVTGASRGTLRADESESAKVPEVHRGTWLSNTSWFLNNPALIGCCLYYVGLLVLWFVYPLVWGERPLEVDASSSMLALLTLSISGRVLSLCWLIAPVSIALNVLANKYKIGRWVMVYNIAVISVTLISAIILIGIENGGI